MKPRATILSPLRSSIPALVRESRSRGRRRKGETPVLAFGPVDDELADRIRAWRLDQARERGVPAYTVFPDSTLNAIAAVKPTSEAELLAIPGMGPGRLERYGEALLGLLGR